MKKKYMVTKLGEQNGFGKAGSPYTSKNKISVPGPNGSELVSNNKIMAGRGFLEVAYDVGVKVSKPLKLFTRRIKPTPHDDGNGRAYNSQSGNYEYKNAGKGGGPDLVSDHQGTVQNGDINW